MKFHWLGWISFAICIILLAKYIGRISKINSVNVALRKTHKPLGVVVLILGAIHGLHYLIKRPEKIVENITGAALLTLLVFLAITFLARKKLKSKWFLLHRIASIVLLIILVAHLVVAIIR